MSNSFNLNLQSLENLNLDKLKDFNTQYVQDLKDNKNPAIKPTVTKSILNFFTKSVAPAPENTIKNTWIAKSAKGNLISHALGFSKIGSTVITDDHITRGSICTKHRDFGKRKCLETKSVYRSGGFDYAEVPLGTWAEVYNGSCIGTPKTTIIDAGGKLTDDVASKCSTRFTDDPDCINKVEKANHTTMKDCFRSGMHYPTFCQMGDFIETVPECKEQCFAVKPEDDNYCSWAKDRYCAIQPGDMITPEKESVEYTITSDTCMGYCGDGSSTHCENAKSAYCSSKGASVEYCKNYWQSRGLTSDASEKCRASLLGGDLLDPESECGKLCATGNEVSSQFCTDLREEYCSKNIFTPYCHEWCNDNLDSCSKILTLNCADKSDLMGNTVEGTDMTYGDWCGCFMPTDTYSNYITDIVHKVEGKGLKWNRLPGTPTPECQYPLCSNNPKAIKTGLQQQNQCGDCIDEILSKYSMKADHELLECDAIGTILDTGDQMTPLEEIPEHLPVSSGKEPPIVSDTPTEPVGTSPPVVPPSTEQNVSGGITTENTATTTQSDPDPIDPSGTGSREPVINRDVVISETTTSNNNIILIIIIVALVVVIFIFFLYLLSRSNNATPPVAVATS